MIWLLRLFRTYRDLEAELAEAAGARIKAEDDVRYWRALCERAEQARDGINAEYTRLLRRMANLDASETPANPEMPAGILTPPPYHRSLREIQQEAVSLSRKTAHDRRMALVNGDAED